MKMAEVAAGGQDWSFEKKDAPANGNGKAVNGEAKAADSANTTLEDDDVEVVDSSSAGASANVTLSPVSSDKLNESNGSGIGMPQLPVANSQPRVDPVNEICTDMQVKIADLGNACWVVSPRFRISLPRSFSRLERELIDNASLLFQGPSQRTFLEFE